MAVDLAKAKNRMKKNKEDKERRGKGGSSTFSVKANKKTIVYFCSPHDNMGGLPWVERLYHNRDLPEEFKRSKPFSIRCMRENQDQDFDSCFACSKMSAARLNRKEHPEKSKKWLEYDGEARKYSPRRRPITQVVDLTSMFDDKLKLVKKMKKCFLKFGEKDNCDSCFLGESCKAGVQRYYTPVGVWEEFGDHLDEEGDITDTSEALCVRIKRVGTGQFDTEYSTKIVKDTFAFPDSVVSRLLSKIEDLTEVDKTLEGSKKEIQKKYEDFFGMNFDDGEDDDEDGDGDEDIPKCFRKYNPKKKKKRGCDKCEVSSSCIDDDEDDEDEDDEDGNDLKKLRKDLSKKARKGKLNRKSKKTKKSKK